MRILTSGFGALTALAMSVSLAGAQTLTDEQLISAREFTVNNTWFVLYHELGHMLVDQLGIPVLSREEDVVDNIATFSLLAQESEEADQALIDASYGWLLSDLSVDTYESSDFYGEHSLDLQRAYAITCLLVGNDPEGFQEAADYMEMDADRQEGCANDYAQFEQSLGAVLSPYLGKDQPISVVYDEAGEDYDWARQLLRRSKVLEKTATDIGESFALPNPITLRATLCDEANAFYDPATQEVLVCYELLGEYFDLFANDILSEES